MDELRMVLCIQKQPLRPAVIIQPELWCAFQLADDLVHRSTAC
jgi:hypothetical protein